MFEALESAEFLTRSENRVAALFALSERPQTRSDLRAETGMSQVTIGRVLGDLEDRRWIEPNGDAYAITAVGEMVADSLDEFLDALGAADTLDDIARWLPTETYDFGLERLGDTAVITPEPEDPNATMRTAARQIASSDHVRILTHGFSTLVIHALYERVDAGEMTVECVFSPEVYEALTAATGVTDEFAALVEADAADFYRYDGEVPHVLAVLDDGVGIGVDDDGGRPVATLGVRDPVVRTWAIETFERYRDGATAIDTTTEFGSPDRPS